MTESMRANRLRGEVSRTEGQPGYQNRDMARVARDPGAAVGGFDGTVIVCGPAQQQVAG